MCASATANESSYRLSQLVAVRMHWEPISQSIVIPRVEFHETTWGDILRELERLSAQHDPNRKGIRIFVPDRFKPAFTEIAARPYTVKLGPNISLGSVFTEMPPPDWLFFPISAREVVVVPQSAINQDLPK